jgi:predicted RNA-binding Zn ribbon-like protein
MHGAMDRFAPGTQPAGRSPAPGRLGLVQAFGNSFWDLDAGGVDEWATADAFGAWLVARGFAGGAGATDADRRWALELREALRDLARCNHGEAAEPTSPRDDDRTPALAILDAAAQRCALRLRFDPAPRHEPAGDGADDAVALVLGVVAEAMADGTWSRMKACPGPHCGWIFYDASRNRSSQWCSMRICGNRVKGRAFRERHRSPT